MIAGSQNDRIVRYLARGKTLTPLSAQRLFDCLRLGGRIHELRRLGFRIRTETLELSNGKRVARYSLAKEKGPGVVS